MRSPRTELLLSQTTLTAASIIFAVAAVVLLRDLIPPRAYALFVVLVVVADVAVFVVYGAYQMRRVVVQPLEAAVTAAEAQLVRAERLAGVGRLAAGVAHEIGNPLGAIHGYAHLLRTRANGDPHAADALSGLEREVSRIDRIVRGLLD